MRALIAAAAIVLGCLTLNAAEPQGRHDSSTGGPNRKAPGAKDAPANTMALDAATLSVSLTAALLNAAEVPHDVLHPDGCYVWQQPGVALVPTALWRAGQAAPELWLDEARLNSLLLDLAHYSWDEPAAFPTEEQELAGPPRQPQVYLLAAARATSRLSKYYASYQSWVELNNPQDTDSAAPPPGSKVPAFDPFLDVPPGALRVDFAVVYLAADGPLEFYLQSGPSGQLYVRHIFSWSYFSA
jgi:hypothetical protein